MKKNTTVTDWFLLDMDEMDAADRMLVGAAKQATQGSYSPYSGFKVGAAVLLDDGNIITGSNQENSAYPSGLCAERTALFSAGHLHPDKAVVALAIAACNERGFTSQPCTPCGSCRQVIAEFQQKSGRPIRFLFYGENGTILIKDGVDAILPFCFGAGSMR